MDRLERSETPAADTPTSLSAPSPGQNFCDAIESAYEKVVHWRRNVFNVPFGVHGAAAFVEELADIISGFAEGTSGRQIAWKEITVACHLLLQKPNASNSSPSFAEHLQRRLLLWK